MLVGILEIIVIVMFVMVSGWTLYNATLFFTGLFSRLSGKKWRSQPQDEIFNEPRVSIIIPVKNGEKVLPRLMNSLLKLDYPLEKMEIILIEDGSTDKSYELCLNYAEKYPSLIKVIHRDTSRGKSDALVYATKYASGDVLAIFDVDSVIEPGTLKRAVKYLKGSDVAAIQGRTISINANYNFLTGLVFLEEACYSIMLEGRNILGLFVPLTGNCMFIRREYLERVGGWNSESLVEDVELSVRFLSKGFRVLYNYEIEIYQEAPSSLKDLYKQRKRWYRGFIETFIISAKLLRKIDLKTIDALILLLSPIFLVLTQLFCISLPIIILTGYNSLLFQVILQFLAILFVISILITAIILLIVTPWGKRSILMGILTYFYWWLLGLITLKSIGDILLKTQREWITTTKRGVI
ncbi:MAG: glycosyltransferase family 2 protein [Crenarchaeota archaeon]|nr:glycosyltransferase family 2 protein [Thermoproteota archaeon]